MASNFREDHKAALDALLLAIPGVSAGKAFGYPAYKVSGKMFAFVGGEGMSLKLPESRVNELIAAHDAMHPFEPSEGRIWKQWVSIDHANSEDYRQHVALYEESVQFVAESA